MDLKTIDIQRSRDHGVASYNDYRELCNLPRAKEFDHFTDVMDSKVGMKNSAILFSDISKINTTQIEKHIYLKRFNKK